VHRARQESSSGFLIHFFFLERETHGIFIQGGFFHPPTTTLQGMTMKCCLGSTSPALFVCCCMVALWQNRSTRAEGAHLSAGDVCLFKE